MTVTDKQKRYLRSMAHELKVVVMVGSKGLTENVLTEIDNALSHHELIKVKISGADRAQKRDIIEQISTVSQASLILSIGHTAAFYRPAETPTIQLP